MPSAARQRRGFRPVLSENALHQQVETFLRLAWPAHLPYTHFPAGELRDPAVGGKLKAMGLKPGWPDFQFILPNGQAAFLELKKPGEDLSDDQVALREKLVALRCGYATARSLEEVEKHLNRWLAHWGLKLRASTMTPAMAGPLFAGSPA